MPQIRLLTKAEWDTITPRQQGMACYFQGSLPGSELKDLENPYPIGSEDRKEFAGGEFEAMLDAQDGED